MEKDLKSFADNKVLLGQIEDELPNLLKEFENLKSLLNHSVTDANFNKAITSFYKIFKFVPLAAPHIDSFELPLFRARANDNKNVLFTKETDISYNSTNIDGIKAGRFNQPRQALFYASLPFENNEINPSMAACLETCKGLTSENDPVLLKDFTIGRWKIKKSFYVINFCFDEEHLKTNLAIKKHTDQYMKAIKDCLNKETSAFILEFLTYFSVMSGRKALFKNEYYILTAMFYAVQYYYKKVVGQVIYGLIYPSATTEAKGLNIVLTTTAVDTFLKPDKIGMYRFILADKTYHADPCSNAVDIKDGHFTITGFRRIPENKLYTIDCENEYGSLRHSKD